MDFDGLDNLPCVAFEAIDSVKSSQVKEVNAPESKVNIIPYQAITSEMIQKYAHIVLRI